MLTAIRQRLPGALGSWSETALTVGAFLVLAALWAGLVYSFVADPALPDHAWTWLRDLAPATQVVVWVAILPIAVGLWLWTASLPLPVAGLLGLGIVAWTVAATVRMIRLLLARG